MAQDPYAVPQKGKEPKIKEMAKCDIVVQGDGFTFNKLSPMGKLMYLLSNAANTCYSLVTSQSLLKVAAEKEKLDIDEAMRTLVKGEWSKSDRQTIEKLTLFLEKNACDENVRFIYKFILVVSKIFNVPYPKPKANKTDPPVGALLTHIMEKHINFYSAKQINIDYKLRWDIIHAWEAAVQQPNLGHRGFEHEHHPPEHPHFRHRGQGAPNVAYMQGARTPGMWQAFSLAHGLKETNLERWFHLKDVVLTEQQPGDVLRACDTGPVVDLADVAVGGHYFVHGRPAPQA